MKCKLSLLVIVSLIKTFVSVPYIGKELALHGTFLNKDSVGEGGLLSIKN